MDVIMGDVLRAVCWRPLITLIKKDYTELHVMYFSGSTDTVLSASIKCAILYKSWDYGAWSYLSES